MRTSLFTCLAALALTAAAGAQAPERPTLELRPVVGAYVPTGDQRDAFKDAFLIGAQGAVEVTRRFHLVASVAWIDGKSRFPTTDRGVSTFQYDAGVELNAYRDLTTGWTFRPFVGAGLGGRTYDYNAAYATRSFFDGYGAAGLELQMGSVGVRVEGRDYVSRYRAPTPGASSATRNDLTLAFGVAYHFGPR